MVAGDLVNFDEEYFYSTVTEHIIYVWALIYQQSK